MNYIEKIDLSPTMAIWKSSFDISYKEGSILECKTIINNKSQITLDSYPFYINNNLNYEDFINDKSKSELFLIMKNSIKTCVELYDKPFNKIKTNSWINVVKTKNPSQKKYSLKNKKEPLGFHSHLEINRLNNLPIPFYTFICYLQMPNNLKGDDGLLFIKDTNSTIYSYLPNEGDILIINGDTIHAPNYAFNSDKDRIVLAGNIHFANKNII
jgi:hypothetical protein